MKKILTVVDRSQQVCSKNKKVDFFPDWLEATGRNVNFEMHESEELSRILH